jgi:hypothetical protein
LSDTRDRDLKIVDYRDAGHTLQQTAIKFGLSERETEVAEERMRWQLAAIRRLATEPDDIADMARAGEIDQEVADLLLYMDIEKARYINGYLDEIRRQPGVAEAVLAAIVDLGRKHRGLL